MLRNSLGLNNQTIIIFGGTHNPVVSNLPPGEALYTLNLNNLVWDIPKTSGQIPKSRMYHTANVIGKYMVISFGKYQILYSMYYYYHFFYTSLRLTNRVGSGVIFLHDPGLTRVNPGLTI